MHEIAKKEIKISDFPPTLRKLAKYLIENVEYGSIKDACESLNLNTDATYVAIHKCRKKGLDLMDYVSDNWKSGLKKAKPLVRNSLVQGAISGKGKAQELFWKLSGDMVDRQETNLNVGLSFVFGSTITPPDIAAEHEERKKIIDLKKVP